MNFFSAFEREGYEAFRDGKTLNDNPHSAPLYKNQWESGWRKAISEYKDKPKMNVEVTTEYVVYVTEEMLSDILKNWAVSNKGPLSNLSIKDINIDIGGCRNLVVSITGKITVFKESE